MKTVGIVTSIVVITLVFIYSLNDLSNDNSCSGVRIFDCQKEENESLVSAEKHNELEPTGNLFLKYCKPKITGDELYIIDYSDCNLKVKLFKDKPWVESVSVNNSTLTRDEINSNF